jgi:hypothetical protein
MQWVCPVCGAESRLLLRLGLRTFRSPREAGARRLRKYNKYLRKIGLDQAQMIVVYF